MAASLEQIVGTVSKVNDNGFQIQERPGTWFNISRYAEPRPDLPSSGQSVVFGLDTKGFVRAIDAPGIRLMPPGPTLPSDDPMPPHVLDARAAAERSADAARGVPNRDTAILRMSCLKTAAAFLASRPDAKSTDLIALAERFETWVGR